MIKKTATPILILLMAGTTAHAQQKKKDTEPKRDRYEFTRNLPAYADSLIADLDYPLAWGNSKIKNFKKWRKAA